MRRITGEQEPLDLVMDAIGGKSWKQSFSLLRPGGRLVPFGAASLVSGERRSIPTALKTLAQTPRFNPIKLASDSKAVIGLNMLKLWDSKGIVRRVHRARSRSGSTRASSDPVVAEAFPLERGPEAHRFIQERKNVGKVVLTL